MPHNNVLPEMIKVSRNCGFTSELHTIISAKFTDHEIEVLHRWLQIVNEERNIEVGRAKNAGRRW